MKSIVLTIKKTYIYLSKLFYIIKYTYNKQFLKKIQYTNKFNYILTVTI